MAKCKECGQSIYSKRSIRQHNFYWSIVNFLWLHQQETVWVKPYNLHQTIKKYVDHTEPILNSKGVEVGRALKSTKIKDMTQKEFNEYFDLVQDFIWTEIVPRHDEAFEKELSQLMGIWR